MHHQQAGYQGMWSKYEVLAIEQTINLPLKGEGIEIVTYVVDTLGYNKLMTGHLELATDLGKAWLSKRGHADTGIPRNTLELFSPQALEPRRCGDCSRIPTNNTGSSAGLVDRYY